MIKNFEYYVLEFVLINAFAFSGVTHRLIVHDVTRQSAKWIHYIYVCLSS